MSGLWFDVDMGLGLTPLEEEILDCCSISGETTTTLHEEMLDFSPGRAALEEVLHDMVARGLLSTERGIVPERATVEDWWDVTSLGRTAIGLRGLEVVRVLVPPEPAEGPIHITTVKLFIGGGLVHYAQERDSSIQDSEQELGPGLSVADDVGTRYRRGAVSFWRGGASAGPASDTEGGSVEFLPAPPEKAFLLKVLLHDEILVALPL